MAVLTEKKQKNQAYQSKNIAKAEKIFKNPLTNRSLFGYNVRVNAMSRHKSVSEVEFSRNPTGKILPYAIYTPPTNYEGGALKCSELTSLKRDRERRSTALERE